MKRAAAGILAMASALMVACSAAPGGARGETTGATGQALIGLAETDACMVHPGDCTRLLGSDAWSVSQAVTTSAALTWFTQAAGALVPMGASADATDCPFGIADLSGVDASQRQEVEQLVIASGADRASAGIYRCVDPQAPDGARKDVLIWPARLVTGIADTQPNCTRSDCMPHWAPPGG